MITARSPQEQVVIDFFRTLNTGDLEAIRGTLHADATWQPMVEGVPGAGIHGPRDKIVDEFLGPVRGLCRPPDRRRWRRILRPTVRGVIRSVATRPAVRVAPR